MGWTKITLGALYNRAVSTVTRAVVGKQSGLWEAKEGVDDEGASGYLVPIQGQSGEHFGPTAGRKIRNEERPWRTNAHNPVNVKNLFLNGARNE